MYLPKSSMGIGVAVLLLVVLAAAGLFAARQLEWYPPRIQVDLEGAVLGRGPFVVQVQERGKGLAHVSVSLVTAGEKSLIHFEEFEAAPMTSRVPVQLDPGQHKLKEGPGVLTVTAADRSYWSFFRGNRATLEKKVTLDFTPPAVEVLADDRYVTQGGSGLVTYRTSPDTARSGIRIGAAFFPAYKGQLADRNAWLAFFSHPYDVPPDERAVIVAEDHAGNTQQAPLAYSVRPLRYRKVEFQVSDGFIRNKIVPLLPEIGGGAGEDPGDQFLKVNRDLRRVNEETIRKTCEASAARKLWDGRFRQLSNSEVQANFADHRSYRYRDRRVGEARHLGYDLAVTRHYPVGASNSGVVTFAGKLGIYGNTVIIDHGFGICTLYSHLSSIAVAVGDPVKAGARVGRTGETGLALGDHLHYGIYIQGVAVLPLEWWDPKWIRDNVTGKLRRLNRDAAPPRAGAN